MIGSQSCDLLFVYGTLKRGFDHPMARHLAMNARYRGKATCRGRLYDLGSFPGLIRSEIETDIVFGDVYQLRNDLSLLATLDDYEGCGANDPQPHAYSRLQVEVTTDEGRMSAWTYVYRLPVDKMPLIAGGRYL